MVSSCNYFILFQHSMLYFFHHYELPAILRMQQVLSQTNQQHHHNGLHENHAPPLGQQSGEQQRQEQQDSQVNTDQESDQTDTDLPSVSSLEQEVHSDAQNTSGPDEPLPTSGSGEIDNSNGEVTSSSDTSVHQNGKLISSRSAKEATEDNDVESSGLASDMVLSGGNGNLGTSDVILSGKDEVESRRELCVDNIQLLSDVSSSGSPGTQSAHGTLCDSSENNRTIGEQSTFHKENKENFTKESSQGDSPERGEARSTKIANTLPESH